jgi:hypothetical protein
MGYSLLAQIHEAVMVIYTSSLVVRVVGVAGVNGLPSVPNELLEGVRRLSARN